MSEPNLTDTRRTLTKILEEWMLNHAKDMSKLNDPTHRYSVQDFFNVTDVLALLKDLKRETVLIQGKKT